MKKKLNAKKIVLIVLAVIIVGIALTFGIIILSYNNECKDITKDERIVMEMCEDEGIEAIEYANFLESAHNGHRKYEYYDVVTKDDHYIVEIAGDPSDGEYCGKIGYSGFFNRSTILKDKIEYRSSDAGQFSDEVDKALNDLNNLYR